MKILQINTDGTGSGAARAMLQLHAGLCQLGHTSKLFVARIPGNIAGVRTMPGAKTLPRKLRRTFRRALIDLRYKMYTKRPEGYERFSSHQSEYGSESIWEITDCEIINLHWISGLIDYNSFFHDTATRIPVVWTLHDMNAFTGGCHYDDGCGKYRNICGACPQLGSRRQRDLAYQIWTKKQRIFTETDQRNVHLVTPSKWLAYEVQESALLKNFPVSVIPNSVDNSVFRPRSRELARQALEIPQDARVVLFVANTMTVKRKGLRLLVEALGSIQSSTNLFLLSVGVGNLPLPANLTHIHLGYVNNDRLLALVYSAADVFVISSLQDNLPNTVLEAMACGIPAVGFAVGGIPDMIRPGYTGLLVNPGDVQGLVQAIYQILEDHEMKAAYSLNCRQVVEQEYTPQVQASRYVELYQQMLSIK